MRVQKLTKLQGIENMSPNNLTPTNFGVSSIEKIHVSDLERINYTLTYFRVTILTLLVNINFYYYPLYLLNLYILIVHFVCIFFC